MIMRRRDFLKAAGSLVALANVSGPNVLPSNAAAVSLAVSESKQTSMEVQGHRILIQTPTQSAIIEKGFLTSLVSKKTGKKFIEGVAIDKAAALQLIYRGNEIISIDESKFGISRPNKSHRSKRRLFFTVGTATASFWFQWSRKAVLFLSSRRLILPAPEC